jgi:uncharacterized membrane protein
MTTEFLVASGIVLLGGISSLFSPLLTRPGIYFSATVEPAFPASPDGRRMLRSFQYQVIAWTIITLGITAWLSRSGRVTVLVLPIFILMFGAGVIYARTFHQVHNKFGVRPPESRVASLSVTPRQRTAGFNLPLCVPPFLALGVTALYLYLHWNELPERFPVHFDMNGEPNRWAARDFGGVYASLLIGLALNLSMAGFAWILSRVSRQTTMQYITTRSLQFLLYPLTFAIIVVSLLPVWRSPFWLVPTVILITVAILIVWSYRKMRSPLTQDPVPEPAGDSYWKAGMFYYNPDDPAIFVSKRVGIGYTLNFGSVWAWVFLLVFAGIPLAAALLVK